MKPIWTSLGAVVGLFTGGTIGIVASFIPVFHWEMAGLIVLVFTTVAGFVAGGFGVTRGILVGGLAGSAPFGSLFTVLAATGSMPLDNPWGIPIWGTGTVVIASFAAAAISAISFQAKRLSAKDRES